MSLSYLFRVSDACIDNILLETLDYICLVLRKMVIPRKTVDMWLRVAAEFESKWDFAHCVGAIDGRHYKGKVSFCT